MIDLLIALFFVYLLPLIWCHIYSFIISHCNLEEDYLVTSETLFMFGFAPFANYFLVIVQTIGFCWQFWIGLYRKTKLYKLNIIENLFYKYAKFILDEKEDK